MRLTVLAFLLALAGCSTTATPTDIPDERPLASEFASPDGTLRAVIRAIKARDWEAYRQCFGPTGIERGEDGVERYMMNPERFWVRLEGIFRGPQTLALSTNEPDYAKGSVTAPDAEGGGIGTIAFERIDGEWKIRSW